MAKRREPIFRLPPYKVRHVWTAKAQTMDWGFTLMGIPALWKQTRGEGVKVAVLDTGASYVHGDLKNAIDEMKDFSGSSRSGPMDVAGHGTHCAGTIAARDDDAGIVGIAPLCRLLIGKVLGDDGSGSSQSVAAGIRWAADQRADVISMSLGSPQPSQQIKAAVDYALARGCIIVAAAGNEGPSLDTVGYPARWPGVVSVGAIDQSKRVAKFSSRGDRVDVCAPGVGIISCWPPNNLAKLDGTSMATPHVAGIVALRIASRRARGDKPETSAQIIEQLKETAIDLGPVGHDVEYGWGLIDPAKLLAAPLPVPVVGGVNLVADDLTESGKAKLRAAGMTHFSVQV